MKPLITIVVCTYNRASILDSCLASLEKQRVDGVRWSGIVVDNNSTDETEQIVQRYIQRGVIPGLRYVSENRQGIIYARIRGIRETNSEFIAFLDDDGMLSTDWLEQALEFLKNHPKAGVVGSRVRLLWEVPPADVYRRHSRAFGEQDYGDQPLKLPFKNFDDLVGNGLIVRRAAVESSGWMNHCILSGRSGDNLESGEDTELLYRVINAGYEAWYNPSMRLQHYITGDRMSFKRLRRLYNGFGHSHFVIRIIRNRITPTFSVRFGMFISELRHLIQYTLMDIVPEILGHRRLSKDSLLNLYRYFGGVEMSLHLLFSGITIRL
jgi:glycosyltransferase involved in cell wall biosynthesis